MLFTVGSGSGASLPYVASNKATFYETQINVKVSDSHTDIGNFVFSVFPRDTSDTTFSAPLCLAKVIGMPLYNLFTASEMAIDFGSSQGYILEIELENGQDIDTGYGDGDVLPSKSDANAVATLTFGEGSTAYITLTGLASVALNADVETFILWSNSHLSDSTSYSYTTRLYYTVTGNDEKYTLQKSV